MEKEDMPVTRLASVADAEALTEQLRSNRDFFAPWMPARDDSFFSVDAQRANLADALDAYGRGTAVPLVILDDDGQLIGRLDLNGITRGAFQSASLGYWVSRSHNGRGFAVAAVADAVVIAFEELRLHRLQAETLLHNTASQRVLTRNGFKPFAVGPAYLQIAGEWQDHLLYHLLNERWQATV
jgi:[ribosomal protein S5]-alanine N-acetyltransferase